jgi:hypothetical protein
MLFAILLRVYLMLKQLLMFGINEIKIVQLFLIL